MCQQENDRILGETDTPEIGSEKHKNKGPKDKSEEIAAAQSYESPGCDVDTAMGASLRVSSVPLAR